MNHAATPDGWSPEAHALWHAGQPAAAIQCVLAAINVQTRPVPRALGLQFVYYVSLSGDWHGAAAFLDIMRRDRPHDFEILLNLGICLSRASQAQAAIAVLDAALQQRSDDPTMWDALADAHAQEKQYAQAKTAGERALVLKAQRVRERGPRRPLATPAATPPAGRQNVIAFSLWGDHPRYLRGALQNAIVAARVYPGWHCRFYLDASVPPELQDALLETGAQIVVEADPAMLTTRMRLNRRFEVANDPGVHRFIVRDCDSVIGLREARAVERWVQSGKGFHVLRDWWTHTDLILAGLWGGVAGVLPDLRALTLAYRSSTLETANWDQWFLRDRVWPLIENDVLVHDSCYRCFGAEPLPDGEATEAYHLGQNEYDVRRESQASALSAWASRLPCLGIGGQDLAGE